MDVEGTRVSTLAGEVTTPPHEVVLISAGASHSVALLCKPRFLLILF